MKRYLDFVFKLLVFFFLAFTGASAFADVTAVIIGKTATEDGGIIVKTQFTVNGNEVITGLKDEEGRSYSIFRYNLNDYPGADIKTILEKIAADIKDRAEDLIRSLYLKDRAQEFTDSAEFDIVGEKFTFTNAEVQIKESDGTMSKTPVTASDYATAVAVNEAIVEDVIR